ncbi:MAG: YfjI family protein [Bryobacteraceae bacterium]
MPAASFDLESWIEAHHLDVEGPEEWQGGKRWIFRTCPWNSAHTNRSAYVVQLPNGAIAAGCHHNGCVGKNWHALRDQVEPGWCSSGQRTASEEARRSDTRREPPLPFHQIDLPAFPAEALPVWLRSFIEAEATATQTPIDLAGMLALSVIAACCAKKVAVCMREGYVEPVNLFTAISLPSGNRKTAVFAAVTKPLEDHERSEAKRTSVEIARQRAERQIKESLLRKLKDQAASAKAKDQERFSQEAAALAVELETTTTGSPTRYIADDCTPERLATLLRDQGGRIAVMSAEGDVFDLMAGRYSSKAMGNFGVFLKGHAGDTLRVDRVGRSEFVKAPAITIGLAVQPDVIRGLAEKPGFRGRGLLGRFLYALPVSLLGHRDPDAPPVPDEIRAAYHANITALLRLPFGTDENGDPEPHLLRLSSDAQATLRDFEARLEPQLSEFGELGGMTDWAGKLVGAVGRIAGILHMALFADRSAPWETPILRGCLASAISIGRYLIPHAKAAFAEMGADAVVEQAKTILRWIEHQNARSFTKRDVHQALRARFKRVEVLDAPLGLLLFHEYIRRLAEPTNAGPGRKPSPSFEVNPLWASQNTHNPQNTGMGPNSEDSEDCE